ncbi:exo-alpha-sialidase [Emticicia oligotrophica DSM 17448]|uniref:exo-alpha-sialidase n=1 Tax=Emticicia oligotrophica (strain DSM 17448 / CIP 109782 / MTCC 6937 / GPTSA100-15) TaxID=929562 RepID=A0ABM5N252_EMTOG|nr:sialidase family protein [Emticicia oligotrophica]AFK03472.1 exo-alpha-sialidase [Emticicia oligotrophica DSM 17448]
MLRTIILCLAFSQLLAQNSVFISGTEGHKSYRIPAIISLPNGNLLAFAEGRVQGSGDFGDINIVMKRSSDNGKTWSSMSTIVDYDSLQAGNPAPVFDHSDPAFPKGRLFLFYNTGNNHENEVRKGKGLREVWYKTSSDGGITWSEGVNITTQVHRPKQTNVNKNYNFQEDWRSYANTPGHAMQFQYGKYRGRIYVAANHSAGEPQKEFTDYTAHGFFTDDHGKTFKLSENISIAGSNEATATEISGNRLMMNMRNQKGDIRQRIVAISENGGETWSQTYFDEKLPDPVCEGAILSLGVEKKKHILAFCNAADTQKRDNLTLRISYDEGKTWQVVKVVAKSNDVKVNDYAAYSDIVKLNKNEIGVLYEKSNYGQIVFESIKWR